MEYFISISIGYIMGSLPTAYLLLKRKGIDITKAGSGNVGAMNTFEVTNSKVMGLIVLVVDLLKGFLSVFFVSILYPENFVFQGLSLIFAIFSHCFNPWIQFNGGRGLATAAGGLLLLLYPFIIIWLLIWFLSYLLKRDIILSNIIAIIFSLILIINNSELALNYTRPKAENDESIVLIFTISLIIIFIKHIDPIKDLIKSYKGIKNDK